VSSWVVIEKASRRVLFETFSACIAGAINRAKYDVIPIAEYLADLNRSIRSVPSAQGRVTRR